MSDTSIMTKGRKTTYDERVEIVKYCIEHELNYAAAAEEYQVSYQQIYQWVGKYKSKGAEGLADKRGRNKPGSELSEYAVKRNRLLFSRNRWETNDHRKRLPQLSTFFMENRYPPRRAGKWSEDTRYSRHTYACHCLKKWVLQGKDLNAYLPILKTYMGHFSFEDTAYYLRLTADIYPDISIRLEGSYPDIIPSVEVGSL